MAVFLHLFTFCTKHLRNASASCTFESNEPEEKEDGWLPHLA
jgi:hypothetical protein